MYHNAAIVKYVTDALSLLVKFHFTRYMQFCFLEHYILEQLHAHVLMISLQLLSVTVSYCCKRPQVHKSVESINFQT